MALHTQGTVLTNADQSLLPSTTGTVPSGQTWRVKFLSIANIGNVEQEVWLTVVDSSASNAARSILSGLPLVSKFKLEPLEGELALQAGDSLRARGATTGAVSLHVVITVDDGLS